MYIVVLYTMYYECNLYCVNEYKIYLYLLLRYGFGLQTCRCRNYLRTEG